VLSGWCLAGRFIQLCCLYEADVLDLADEVGGASDGVADGVPALVPSVPDCRGRNVELAGATNPT
jgi:hypothetical protein